MATRTQLVRVPLGRGLAQDQEDKLVTPGSVGEAHNVVVNRAGAYDKRVGWGRLPVEDENGVQLDAPDRVDPVGSELLQTSQTDGRVWSWGPGREQWEELGWLPPFSVDREILVRTASTLVTGTLAKFGTSGRYTLIAWQHGAGPGLFTAYSQVRDSETGALIVRDTAVYPSAGLTYPIAQSIGDEAWIVYSWPDVRIRRYKADLSVVETSIFPDPVVVFDACAVDNGTNLLVAWGDLATGDVNVRLYDSTGALLYGRTIAAITPTDIAVCDGPSGSYLVAWTTGAAGARDLRLLKLASDLSDDEDHLVETGAESITAPVLGVDHLGFIWVAWYGRLTSTSTDVEAMHVRAIASGAVQAFRRQAWRCFPAAFPQRIGEGLYLPVGAATASGLTDQHLALVQLNDALASTPPRYAGVLVRQTAAAATKAQRWVAVGDGTYQLAAIVVTREQLYGSDVDGIDLVTIDPAARPRMPAVRLPQQHVWASNGLWSFDSYDVTDVNFLQPPELDQDPLTALTTGGGGPYFPDGKYFYRARYEAIDDAGVAHVSPWSNDLVVDLAGTPNVAAINVRIATVQLTQHGRRGLFRRISVALYRSDVNGVVDGVGTLYRLTRYGSEATAAPLNQPRITYADDEVDAASAELGFITTSGGILEARPAPPAHAMTLHRGRLWLASSEADRRIWFSQELQTDETPRWHEALTVQLVDLAGQVEALASLDANLIALSRSRLYQIVGDGPADTGQNGAFTAYPIASAFGCVDRGSVVVTSRGVYFRSASGICLLDRSLSVSVVGDPVRDLLEQAGAEIRHAVYHEAQARVVFHLWTDDGETRASTLLIYDERQAVWTTADSLEVDKVTHLAYDPSLQALTFAGPFNVLREGYGSAPGFDGDPDNPTWFGARIRSPWLRAGEVGSRALLRIVHLEGEVQGAGTWTVEAHRNYDEDSTPQSATIDLTAASRGDRVVRQLGPKTQTWQSLRLGLIEQAPETLPSDTAAPQGVRWWGLVLDLALEEGLALLPGEQRGGLTLWRAGWYLPSRQEARSRAGWWADRWARASE